MNTNAKHTDGPWRADVEDYPFRREIYIETENFDPDAGEGERIARVFDETDTGRANARLIAAAPALLEALRELTAKAWLSFDFHNTPEGARNVELMKKAGDAIAQAEGGAQ